MAYFIPSSIQKRLLRYALFRTGFLDTEDLNLDSLDIVLGRQNKIELKNVGLQVKKITSLLQLPEELSIISARILLLRLNVPADLYNGSIVAEVEGIELKLALDVREQKSSQGDEKGRRPESTKGPSHRKTSRRLHSPSPHDPGGSNNEDIYMPNTQDLAKSFLQEEPLEEKKQLEALYTSKSRQLDESVISETSEESELGTGTGLGLPNFLAGFLQGILDRFRVHVKNVVATLDIHLPCDGEEDNGANANRPRLLVVLTVQDVTIDGAAKLSWKGQEEALPSSFPGKRRISVKALHLQMICPPSDFDRARQPLGAPSTQRSNSRDLIAETSSPSNTLPRGHVSDTCRVISSQKISTAPSSQSPPASSVGGWRATPASPKSGASFAASERDRFADATDPIISNLETSTDLLDIQPGEDNISYAHRRSRLRGGSSHTWRTPVQDADPSSSVYSDDGLASSYHESQARPVVGLSPIMHDDGSAVASQISGPAFNNPAPSAPASDSDYGDQMTPSAFLTDLQSGEAQSVAAGKHNSVARESEDTGDVPPHSQQEDLSQSTIYDQDEDTSMYMSALSERSSASPDLRKLPGHWGSGDSVEELDPRVMSQSVQTLSTEADQTIDEDAAPTPRAASPDLTQKDPGRTTGTDTQSTVLPHDQVRNAQANATPDLRKELLTIDELSIWIPTGAANIKETNEEAPLATSSARRGSGMTSSYAHHMPGAFSQYAEQSASVRFDSSFMAETVASLPKQEPTPRASPAIVVRFGQISIKADLAVSQWIYKLSVNVRSGLGSAAKTDIPKPKAPQASKHETIALEVQAIRFKLVESMEVVSAGAEERAWPLGDHVEVSKSLSHISVTGFKIGIVPTNASPDLDIAMEKFVLGLGDKDVLFFTDGSNAQVESGATPDVSLEITHALRTTRNKLVSQISLNTRCVGVDLDLQNIDDTLGTFGGLSGLLELSASIMSSGQMSPESKPTPAKKGVHFQDTPKDLDDAPENKINARLSGLSAVVAGTSSALTLATSTLKLVSRPDYIAASIDSMKLHGPFTPHVDTPSPVLISLNTTRLEYLFSPKDTDLERLLSLLTPSKNKYENDDDILLDTLLRQRRKGAVLRLTTGLAQVDVLTWDFVDRLKAFGDEVSQLSSVTKYLPEDERPGLLTLVRVNDLHAQLPVSESFDVMDVHCKDVQVAQIGLPALMAFAIGTVRAGRPGDQDIVHDLIPVSPSENLPMIMARMIGDEIEPTCKIKLFNLCLEYSVPTFLALTGLGVDVKAEEVVDLAASVMIDLAGTQGKETFKSPSSSSEASPSPVKKLSVDLLFHDCAVGLKPTNDSSKALLVLGNTRFTTMVPPQDVFKGTLELRKASLHLTNDEVLADKAQPSTSISQSWSAHLSSALSRKGFVSVTSIMAASAIVHITESVDKDSRFVDLEFRDELFVLETCADSTQTLIKLLNGLSPPSKPSKGPKFRTEAMSMEDMVSSFTGNAYEKPQPPPSTIFDANEPPSPEDDNDFLAATGMSESIYGFGEELPDPEEGLMIQDDGHTDVAESLLEEDPFEMPTSPTSHRLGNDALLRDLKRQCQNVSDPSAVELKPFLLSPRQLDRLPGASTVLGSPHRWNTPMVKFPTLPTNTIEQLPVRLRIRDVHVIWNLYDGYDWQQTRAVISNAVEEVEAKAEARKMRRRASTEPDEDEESVIGDCLFNSIYIGIPANRDPHELRRQINRGIDDLASESESYANSGISRPTNLSSGQQYRSRARTRRLKLERSRAHKIAFELKGVSADILVFPPGVSETQNSVDVRVRDFEIFDNVPTSTWKKFLTSYHDNDEMREMCKPMIHLGLLNVRPVLELAVTEIVMRVSVMPLRLHVDQDALDFITRFFEFKDDSAKDPEAAGDQPFLQRVEVNTVTLVLDYKPKKVDYAGLRSGKSTEFMNFVILDKAHIQLKHAIVYGVRSFDALHDTLNDVWMPDVKRNQLPGILSGLAPVSSLVSIGQGFCDVVSIPVREYQKDGRLVRSIQKGAVHFMRNTTSEIARFGAKMAVGTQNVLQGAETMLSSPSERPVAHRRVSDQGWTDVDSEDEREQRKISNYADQPLGVLQGLKSARRYLEHDLLTARDAFIAVQGEVMESSSAAGVVGAVARRAPTIVLRPVIGASRAVGQTLMGVGNQVDRGNVRRIEDKYKSR